jgi:hypothetical protein
MKADEYEALVAQARQRTQACIAAAQTDFALGKHSRYEIDLPSAKIRFFDDGDVECVQADIQVAGSWSPASESWLWGWENQSVPAAASSRVVAVREFGDKNRLQKLRASFERCDEGEAWSMASLALHLLDAQCVYRVRNPKSQLFLLLFSIRAVA